MSSLFRDLEGACLCPNGSVVCIGAFDGLHPGHHALVRHAVTRARALGITCVALSFEPLPREYFGKSNGHVARLTPPRQKIQGLHRLGVETVGLLRFNAQLAALSAEAFVRDVLVKRLAAREVWVGPDFRFGHERAGDLAFLRAMGARLGFDAGEIAPVMVDGQRVSSTRIRAALAEGNVALAARLLGGNYTIAGRVVRGQQLGRALGYPTANVRLHRNPQALRGIFAARVHGATPRPWPAVISVGTRPTVGGVEPLLEAHLFDYDGDLYGRRIEVEFIAKLRDEARFADLPTLVAQMHRDAAQARAILHDLPKQAFA